MSKWISNLRAVLDDKPVVLLHGNVRDRYIDEQGSIFENLTKLLENLACQLPISFNRLVFYDLAGRERVRDLSAARDPALGARPSNEFEDTKPQASSRQQEPPSRTLARWARDLSEPHQSVFSVIFYLDKLVPYKTSYSEEEREALLWLEKAIENIARENRLVMVALRDTMVPIELYTHSPKCRLLVVPLPDKADRKRYLGHQLLGEHEHLDLIADLTDGLYLMELAHITDEVREARTADANQIRRIVNRYRIGEQEDYWNSISIAKLDGAFEWFTDTEGVKGQDQAVNKVEEVLALARAGLSGIASGTTAKPKGTLFFAGPSGVGKTFVAKKLAKFLFNTEEAFTRFDMSEFKEEHTVSKLIGSPPGYVGYEQGGMLTNAVRERPFSVVLFDEFEKAHPRIMDIFLQMLDEGRLTDSRGQTVFFTETVIILTSNIGCRTLDNRGNPITELAALDSILANTELSFEESQQSIRNHFLRAVEQFFMFEISRPELLNRIGSNIVPFNYIHSPEIQREIVASHLKRIEGEFEDKYRQSGYHLVVDDEVLGFLVEKHGRQMARFGGRGVTNALESEIIRLLARAVLQAEYDRRSGVRFRITLSEQRLRVEAGSAEIE
jgi:ATP-dependent Clp protease ATP-binding subunit ClpA